MQDRLLERKQRTRGDTARLLQVCKHRGLTQHQFPGEDPKPHFPSLFLPGEGSPPYPVLQRANPEVSLRAGERRLFSFSPPDVSLALQTVAGTSGSKARWPPISSQRPKQKGKSEERLGPLLPSHSCTVRALKRRRNGSDPASFSKGGFR